MNDQEIRQVVRYLLDQQWAKPPAYDVSVIFQSFTEFLSDLPYSVVRAACEQWAVENVWFPLSSQIRQKAVDLLIMSRPVKPIGDMWEELLAHRRSLLAVHPTLREEFFPSNDSLATQFAKALGGWKRLLGTPDDKLDYLYRDFQTVYNTQMSSARNFLLLSPTVRQLVYSNHKGFLTGWVANNYLSDGRHE